MTGERRSDKVRTVTVGREDGANPAVSVLGYAEIILEDQCEFSIRIVARTPRVNPLAVDTDVSWLNVDASRTSSPLERRSHLLRVGVQLARLAAPVDPDFQRRGRTVGLQRVQRLKELQ